MLNIFWRIIAKVIAHPAIADWLIARAKLTPYQHIMSADGTEMYMVAVQPVQPGHPQAGAVVVPVVVPHPPHHVAG